MRPANYRIPHDDSKYRNIVHISHGDVLKAIDTGRRGLKGLQAPVGNEDWASAYQLWDGYFRSRKKHLDFFNPEEFARLVSGRPSQVRKILRQAGEILDHRIQYYGYRVHEFGDMMNFSPGQDRSALYGFHYWYWSHSLMFAYALNRDPRYADVFDLLFNQWYDQRDSVDWRIPNLDPIWYELGLCRINRFVAFYSLFRNEEAVRPITRERLLATLLGHGRALYGFVKGTRKGGNFQFNSTLALTHLALAMPEFKESRQWIRESLQTAVSLLRNAVYADGGFTERCPSYASFSLGFMTEICRVLGDFPEHAKRRNEIRGLLDRCYDWYMNIITPLGEFPPFGDAHTRSAIPMLSGGIASLDLKTLRAVVAPNLGRIRRERLPVQYTHRAREADLSILPADPTALPDYTSKHFPDSHWTVMRTGWRPTSHYMAINHGPIAGHAHREALSFNLYAFGEPLAVELDLAVSRGYDDPLCDFMRSSRSHNMVVLDEECIEATSNPIDLWAGQDVVWHTDDAIDYFSGWHRGYLRTKNAIVTRKVLFVKPHFWLIQDRVSFQKPGRVKTSAWYLHSCHPFTSKKEGWTTSGEKAGLDVIPVGLAKSAQFESRLENRQDPDKMELDLLRNYHPARHYMKLTQRVTRSLPHQDHCFVLHPRRKGDRSRTSVELVSVRRNGKAVKSDEAQALKVTCGRRTHLVFLNHTDPGTSFEIEGTEVTGRAGVCNFGSRKNRWTVVG